MAVVLWKYTLNFKMNAPKAYYESGSLCRCPLVWHCNVCGHSTLWTIFIGISNNMTNIALMEYMLQRLALSVLCRFMFLYYSVCLFSCLSDSCFLVCRSISWSVCLCVSAFTPPTPNFCHTNTPSLVIFSLLYLSLTLCGARIMHIIVTYLVLICIKQYWFSRPIIFYPNVAIYKGLWYTLWQDICVYLWLYAVLDSTKIGKNCIALIVKWRFAKIYWKISIPW